ncbi:hypothetical protein BFJ66_g16513 [Fusarium oxysporum f. sp. cepae]|uniref:Uncharacterized protein n=1 Tax=Fusarium oxysporum f. sp. cepae TaxID=396571 RepID=A0A3L6N218_FUSOX|nr:hypothetical protein BFJ65_g14600 [Fusarium oxysporum f. sp. cepae]RKK27754.1 hypothetical protein BFJ66_g16513 [Fusarium oxysporum f. sp. cepae]
MMLAGYKNAATAHTAKLLSFGPAGSSQTSNPPTLPPDASLINRGFLYLLRIPSNTSLVRGTKLSEFCGAFVTTVFSINQDNPMAYESSCKDHVTVLIKSTRDNSF